MFVTGGGILTNNEKRVLDIIKSNPYISQKDIGEELDLSRSTVATIVSSLTKKNYIAGRAYILNEVDSPIFVIGAMNVDRKFNLEKSIIYKTSNPASSESFVGGVGRNVAENLGRLGHDVKIISVAGYDQDFEFIKKSTDAFVDFNYVRQIQNASTGNYSAIIDSSGEMEVAIADMGIYNSMDIDFIKDYENILINSKVIILDLNIPEETVEYVINFAKNNDIFLFVVPVSSPKINRLPNDLTGIDYIVVNQDESEGYFNVKVNSEDDFFSLGSKWINKGVKEVIITRGKKTFLYENYKGERYFFTPPLSDNVVDVTGAGDSFTSGIIHGFIKGVSTKDSVEFAMTNSYYTIQSKNTVRDNLTNENLQKERDNLKERGLIKW